MRFADLKNDFVFRKIFGHHPDLLAALLNDLLGLTGQELIDELAYLPAEQSPEVALFKVSIVDVKCRQRSGRTFVVEMQLAHYAGFDKRAVYNTSKAYVQQLPQGGKYNELADVVGVSICNFEVFPNQARAAQGQVLVPMVSRWKLTEQQSGASDGLPQLQLVFLELPKLRMEEVSLSGAAAWAWLFREARGFDAIPAGLPGSAYVRALELANEATFSEAEREAYRHLQDEIDVSLDLLQRAERAQHQLLQAQQATAQAKQEAADAQQEAAAAQQEAAAAQQEAADAQQEAADAQQATAQAKQEAADAQQQAADAQQAIAQAQQQAADAQQAIAQAQQQAADAQQEAADVQQAIAQAKQEAADVQQQLEHAQQQARLAEEGGLRLAIEDACELLAIDVSPERRVRLAALTGTELAAWRATIKATKAWPE